MRIESQILPMFPVIAGFAKRLRVAIVLRATGKPRGDVVEFQPLGGTATDTSISDQSFSLPLGERELTSLGNNAEIGLDGGVSQSHPVSHALSSFWRVLFSMSWLNPIGLSHSVACFLRDFMPHQGFGYALVAAFVRACGAVGGIFNVASRSLKRLIANNANQNFWGRWSWHDSSELKPAFLVPLVD